MAPTVRLREIARANAGQRRFVKRAISRLGEALADPAFLPAVEHARYVETRWTPLCGNWKSLTGREIAARIAGGLERGTEIDRVLDFSFDLIELPGPESGHQVLGSTSLGCQPIHTARWFVDWCARSGDAVNLASHFMHEWMHVSGFYHWPDNSARGDAAYVVGRLVRESLAAKYLQEIDPAITALMHDIETDCGCRGNPPS